MFDFFVYYITLGVVSYLFVALNSRLLFEVYLKYRIGRIVGLSIYRKRILVLSLVNLLFYPVTIILCLVHGLICDTLGITLGDDLENFYDLMNYSDEELSKMGLFKIEVEKENE